MVYSSTDSIFFYGSVPLLVLNPIHLIVQSNFYSSCDVLIGYHVTSLDWLAIPHLYKLTILVHKY